MRPGQGTSQRALVVIPKQRSSVITAAGPCCGRLRRCNVTVTVTAVAFRPVATTLSTTPQPPTIDCLPSPPAHSFLRQKSHSCPRG
ncbi:hypothetical protein EVAR_77508_1 [Eumeta japonica]|uniref:Uncharacterized protein n=1 Tax=Eumeta variegata TaxID=151549 RepID=A0A4C1T799_EUMVA|nr:hypothetical protein EVAR_77508_1 [Eumeta japonica]